MCENCKLKEKVAQLEKQLNDINKYIKPTKIKINAEKAEFSNVDNLVETFKKYINSDEFSKLLKTVSLYESLKHYDKIQ